MSQQKVYATAYYYVAMFAFFSNVLSLFRAYVMSKSSHLNR